MKAWCIHRRPWFKCGVCEDARKMDEWTAEQAERDREYAAQRIMTLAYLGPPMSCRVANG